jgi:hypothetical protein
VVAYTPVWEPLADALKRVMATGESEAEAKIDLCRAVADRKIDVQVRIAASEYGMRGQVCSGGNVDVPVHLHPRDFDWVQSRPLKPWPIGPKFGEHYWSISGWKNRLIDLIELLTAHVTDVLSLGAEPHDKQAYAGSKSKSDPGAKTRGITEAISQLWPNEIPKGLSAKEHQEWVAVARCSARARSA